MSYPENPYLMRSSLEEQLIDPSVYLIGQSSDQSGRISDVGVNPVYPVQPLSNNYPPVPQQNRSNRPPPQSIPPQSIQRQQQQQQRQVAPQHQ